MRTPVLPMGILHYKKTGSHVCVAISPVGKERKRKTNQKKKKKLYTTCMLKTDSHFLPLVPLPAPKSLFSLWKIQQAVNTNQHQLSF